MTFVLFGRHERNTFYVLDSNLRLCANWCQNPGTEPLKFSRERTFPDQTAILQVLLTVVLYMPRFAELLRVVEPVTRPFRAVVLVFPRTSCG